MRSVFWGLMLLSVAACSGRTEPTLTDPNVHRTSALCNLGGVLLPVVGVLRGSPDEAPAYVWLEEEGRRQYVAWPAGFRVRLEPAIQLLDESGAVVASEGDEMKLGKVAQTSHAGTIDDPYPAIGDIGGGCYS